MVNSINSANEPIYTMTKKHREHSVPTVVAANTAAARQLTKSSLKPAITQPRNKYPVDIKEGPAETHFFGVDNESMKPTRRYQTQSIRPVSQPLASKGTVNAANAIARAIYLAQ